MKIVLLSSDRPLADMLVRSVLGPEESLVCTADPECATLEAQSDCGMLIVSDRLATDRIVAAVAERSHKESREPMRVWLMSNHHHTELQNAVLKERLADGWAVVPPGLSIRQVAERIGQWMGRVSFGSSAKRNGLIQFVGTTPNIGTTSAAFGTAAAMSQLTGKRVGYVCLNLKSSRIHRYLGDDRPAATLDGLRPELKAGYLTSDRLIRQCRSVRQFPGLSVLYGNVQREQADYYTIEEIDGLLGAAKEAFEYCILDTNAYWDNAATIGVLRQAGQRIVVTTPQPAHFHEDLARWCRALAPLFGLSTTDFDLLIVQQERESSYSSKKIAELAEMPRIGEIRRFIGIEQYLNEGTIEESLAKESGYKSDLVRLARAVLALHGETLAASRLEGESIGRWAKWLRFGRRLSYAGE